MARSRREGLGAAYARRFPGSSPPNQLSGLKAQHKSHRRFLAPFTRINWGDLPEG
jgi:hypothetical protein